MEYVKQAEKQLRKSKLDWRKSGNVSWELPPCQITNRVGEVLTETVVLSFQQADDELLCGWEGAIFLNGEYCHSEYAAPDRLQEIITWLENAAGKSWGER